MCQVDLQALSYVKVLSETHLFTTWAAVLDRIYKFGEVILKLLKRNLCQVYMQTPYANDFVYVLFMNYQSLIKLQFL